MRNTVLAVIVLVMANACWAEDATIARGILDGKKIKFLAMSAAEGVKATTGLLESCHDESLFDADELKRAEQGDHIRPAVP